VYAVAGIALLLASSFYLLKRRADESSRLSMPGVPTATVRIGNLERIVRLSGTTTAAERAWLRAPRLRGRRDRGGGSDFNLELRRLAVPGARVDNGDVVAAFDVLYMRNRLDDERMDRADQSSHLKAAIAEAEFQIKSMDLEIRRAKARLDKAALDLKTAEVRSAIQVAHYRLELEEASAVHKALVTQRKDFLASQNATVQAARLNLRAADVEVRRARANLDRMTIRAPVAGIAVVSDIFRGADRTQIRNGDALRPGQPFLQIVDPRSMVVSARVNQVDVEILRLGAPARVHFEAFPGLLLHGRVTAIVPLADNRGRRREYLAEVPISIRLDRNDRRLLPNLTVFADVVLDREENLPIVPKEAIFIDDASNQPYTHVRTASGWERRDLELGLDNHVAYAVTAGVAEGEVVACSLPPATPPGS
jgi:multidrug efflux pump subunit AcrA (membrane-fusion protein)